MPSPLIRYALDPTGINPDNAVNAEVKTLSTTQIRAAAPTYGPFFTESLIVYEHGTNRLLVRGVDYQCVELLQEATLRFGKEIAQLVLVINPGIGSQIRMNYQVLGGLYQNNVEGLVNMYNTVIQDGRPVDWINVLNKPTEYPPTLHRHYLEDVYGFEPLVVSLERIRNAIILSDVPAFEELIEWVKTNSSGVITDPVVPSVTPDTDTEFTITTSNKRNNTKYYWTIKHHGTVDDNFRELGGSINIFQNKGTFTLKTSKLVPESSLSFDILIHSGSASGPVVTTIEGIVIPGGGVVVEDNSMMTLLNTCCVYRPGIKRNARSLYVIGENT